jgi:hypothetical protein
MFKRVLLITIGLTAIGGTALACNEYTKPKVEKISVHSGDSNNENHTKTCIKIQTDAPLTHNKHCKPTSTPVATPKVTPTPTPKATPTSVSPKPTVTPTATPVSTPAASQAVKNAAPTVLPSVGGSGRKHP